SACFVLRLAGVAGAAEALEIGPIVRPALRLGDLVVELPRTIRAAGSTARLLLPYLLTHGAMAGAVPGGGRAPAPAPTWERVLRAARSRAGLAAPLLSADSEGSRHH